MQAGTFDLGDGVGAADLPTLMKALGWEETLKQFVAIFPKIDLTVNVLPE